MNYDTQIQKLLKWEFSVVVKLLGTSGHSTHDPASSQCVSWEVTNNGSSSPRGRPKLSSRLLALAWPVPGCCGHLWNEPAERRPLCHCIYISFKQNENKQIKNKNSWQGGRGKFRDCFTFLQNFTYGVKSFFLERRSKPSPEVKQNQDP